MELEANRAWTRGVRQQLEGWRRAGLTHLPRIVRAPTPLERPGESPIAHADAAAPVPITSQSLIQENTPAAVSPAKPVAPTSEPLSRADRISQLQVMSDRVAACTRCDELARTRTKTVFGVGDPQAKILFIGEAPGADEDRQGEPFVGRAGQLLTKIIEACQLKREQVYICNILKCRPPDNRTPLPDECTHCREYLDSQLRIINPEYIVCWGAVAAQNLLAETSSIGKLRGKFFRHGAAKVLCTYHPSYLLRNPAAKKDVWDDMKFLFADMGIDLSRA